MKAYFSFLLLWMFSAEIFAQENGVTFKQEYAPNSEYQINTETKSSGNLKFEGDEKFNKLLKKAGQPSEMKTENASTMKVFVQTGEKKNNETPFVFTYQDISQKYWVNGKELSKNLDLEGLKIIGKYLADQKVEIEKIEGKNVDDDLKKIVTSAVSQFSNNLKFPEKPMKIGDSFTQETPLNFPIQGMGNLAMKIIMKYTLKRVENENAYFDLVTTMTMDNTVNKEYALEANGGGNGALIYNLKDQIISKMESVLDIAMNVKIVSENVTIKNNSKTTSMVSTVKIK